MLNGVTAQICVLTLVLELAGMCCGCVLVLFCTNWFVFYKKENFAKKDLLKQDKTPRNQKMSDDEQPTRLTALPGDEDIVPSAKLLRYTEAVFKMFSDGRLRKLSMSYDWRPVGGDSWTTKVHADVILEECSSQLN